MTRPAADLQYTAEHEWVAVDGDIATVGITAYAADKLGDVVYVDLPDGRARASPPARSSARSSRPSRSASCSRPSTARSSRSTRPSSTTRRSSTATRSAPAGSSRCEFTELPAAALARRVRRADRASESSPMPSHFADRHIGTDAAAQAAMLDAVGYDTVDALDGCRGARPRSASTPTTASAHPRGRDRARGARRAARARRHATACARSMIGLGYYDTITPAVIQRNVLENPSWYTAYTPYQPEISQGRLEALINFQTMVDRPHRPRRRRTRRCSTRRTAVVEGMLLARRASKSKRERVRRRRRRVPADEGAARATAPRPSASSSSSSTSPRSTPPSCPTAFGVFVQYPGASGRVWDPRAVIDAVKAHGGLAVVAADLLALTLLTSPGELGADVAVGTTPALRRADGLRRPARRLHGRARRPRAPAARPPGRRLAGCRAATPPTASACRPASSTSAARRRRRNICTAQVLLAVMASCTRSTTAPGGSSGSRSDVHRHAADSPARCGPRERRARARRRSSTRCRCACRDARPRSSPRPHEARHTCCARSTPTRVASLGRRDDDRRATLDAVLDASSASTPRRSAACRTARRDACPTLCSHERLPHAPGLQHAPLRDRHDALPQVPRRQGLRARPRHDPARLVHDEAQRGHRDGRRHLAGVRGHPPVRPRRPTSRATSS